MRNKIYTYDPQSPGIILSCYSKRYDNELLNTLILTYLDNSFYDWTAFCKMELKAL